MAINYWNENKPSLSEIKKRSCGRPPIIKNINELVKKVNAYFESCYQDIGDGELIRIKTPNVSGLAKHLGFASRQSYYDYIETMDEYSYTLQRARLSMEENLIDGLMNQEFLGAKFLLSAMFGFSEKVEQTITTKNVTIDV